MNETAKKKARQAELEYILMKVCREDRWDSFEEFLRCHCDDDEPKYWYWRGEAKELIALYEVS